MNLYVDLATGNIVESVQFSRALDSLTLKRGDNLSVIVQFGLNGVVQDLGDGSETGKLGIKEMDDFTGNFLAAADSWTKSGTGTSAEYTFSLNLNTTELNTAFGATPEPETIPAMLEIQWNIAGAITSTMTLGTTIENDVIQGDEGDPVTANSGAFRYLTANANANVNDAIQADTTGGAFTIALPATPPIGAAIIIEDAALTWGTHALTVGRNGSKINSSATDFSGDVSGGKLTCVYINSTIGWSIK